MIERIYIHNYRCFENFSLDLTNCPSALIIGKNGAGKSAFREALGVLQRLCRGRNRVGELIGKSDFAQGRTHLPLRFEVQLSLGGARCEYEICFEWPEHFREARISAERLTVDGGDIFRREHARIALADGAAFNLDGHVAALPVIHEQRVGDRSLQRVKAYLAAMILLAPVPVRMSGLAETESSEIDLEAAECAAWLRALLQRHPQAYALIDGYLKHVLADFDSFENAPRGGNGTQLVLKFLQADTGRDLPLDFQNLSDGEKCFLLSALVVAASKVNGPIFCFWDEPDSHLSLPEVQHFITTLRKTAHDKSQFLATSHHPLTIRSFSDENTFVFLRKSHLEPTIPRRLADCSYQGDLIHALVRDEVGS